MSARRTATVLTVTVAGTVGVLVYSPPLERLAEAAESAGSSGATGAADGALAAADLAAGDRAGEKQTGKKRVGTEAGSDPAVDAASLREVDGTQERTPRGPVQVRVRLDGDQVRDVVAVQLPDASRHSRWLSEQAAAVLRAEVVQAQSADVDMVSGATFTSEAYLRSLQAALDTAAAGGGAAERDEAAG